MRPREWREEEAEALHALAASAAAARANAELYQGVRHEQQRSEAILANVADGIVAVDRDGKVVLWNPAAERVTGVPQADALGTNTDARRSAARSTPARGSSAAAAAPDPARIRGGLALAQRSGDDRPRRSGGRPDLRLPRHLRRAQRRADEVRLRLDRLARAAHAADVDLRLRRDPAAPGRPLRRRGAGDVPPLHRLRVGAADGDRRPPALRRAARHRRDGGSARGDGRRRRRQRGGPLRRGSGRPERPPLRRRRSPTSRSRPQADREKLGQVLAHLLDNAVRYSPAGGTVTVAARRSERRRRGQRRGRGRRHPARRAGADLPQVLPRRCRLAGAVGAGRGGTRALPRRGPRRRDGRQDPRRLGRRQGRRRSCSSCVAAESET